METSQATAVSAVTHAATAQARGLLLAFSNPPGGEGDAFNTWYDDHAASRLTVPGILNARRYPGIDQDGRRYMACHDLETRRPVPASQMTLLIGGPALRKVCRRRTAHSCTSSSGAGWPTSRREKTRSIAERLRKLLWKALGRVSS